MSRTLAPAPPTDRGYWRRLLVAVHPDRGGAEDLFIWVVGLHEHVAGDDLEPVVDARPRRARYRDHAASEPERVPFDRDADHDVLTDRAVSMADAVAEPFAFLLRSLAGCYRASEADGPLYHQQRRGASYRSLAFIGYKVGMSKRERIQWYAVCRSIPLSQRHASCILSYLEERAA